MIDFRTLADADRERLLAWRNTDEVRRQMIRDAEITPDEHARWFARRLADDEPRVWIAEWNGRPVGAVYMEEHSLSDGWCYWGMYVGEADARRAGIGAAVAVAFLDRLFALPWVHKVCGRVLATNDNALRFNRRLGFTIDGRLREHVARGAEHIDLYEVSQTAAEWAGNRPVLAAAAAKVARHEAE